MTFMRFLRTANTILARGCGVMSDYPRDWALQIAFQRFEFTITVMRLPANSSKNGAPRSRSPHGARSWTPVRRAGRCAPWAHRARGMRIEWISRKPERGIRRYGMAARLPRSSAVRITERACRRRSSTSNLRNGRVKLARGFNTKIGKIKKVQGVGARGVEDPGLGT